ESTVPQTVIPDTERVDHAAVYARNTTRALSTPSNPSMNPRIIASPAVSKVRRARAKISRREGRDGPGKRGEGPVPAWDFEGLYQAPAERYDDPDCFPDLPAKLDAGSVCDRRVSNRDRRKLQPRRLPEMSTDAKGPATPPVLKHREKGIRIFTWPKVIYIFPS